MMFYQSLLQTGYTILCIVPKLFLCPSLYGRGTALRSVFVNYIWTIEYIISKLLFESVVWLLLPLFFLNLGDCLLHLRFLFLSFLIHHYRVFIYISQFPIEGLRLSNCLVNRVLAEQRILWWSTVTKFKVFVIYKMRVII